MIELYILLGMAAGLLAGLLGVGGGLIIVPALAAIFVHLQYPPEVLMHMAIATSLATIVVTSIVSAWAHHRHGAVLWPVVAKLIPGILLGAIAGAWLAGQLPTSSLRIAFGVFEILVAIQMGLSLRPLASRHLPQHAGMTMAGGVIGAVSALVGIGGGTLTVPFLYWCRVAMRQAVATSAACGLPIAIAGMAAYIMLGWDVTGLPVRHLGYIDLLAWLWIAVGSILFAPLGAKLAHRLPVTILKRIFAVLLFIIGVRMLIN